MIEEKKEIVDIKPDLTKTSSVLKKKSDAKVVAKIPRNVILADETLDYSHLYRNFYDIFVGHHNGIKDFDLNYCIRDTRNIFASFVNLLDTNALMMQ